MATLEDIHENILNVINEEGARVGIALYRQHSKLYESAPPNEASAYWRDLFSKIVEKEGSCGLSMLAKDDPYLGDAEFPRTMKEFRGARTYRQKPLSEPRSTGIGFEDQR